MAGNGSASMSGHTAPVNTPSCQCSSSGPLWLPGTTSSGPLSEPTSSRWNSTVIRSSLLSGPNGKSWWYFRWVAVPGSFELILDSRNRRLGPINWVTASSARLERIASR